MLLGHLFLGGDPPPAPYPAAGEDPTEDGLPCPASEGLGYEPMEAEYLGRIFNRYPPSLAQEDTFRRNGFVAYHNVRFDSMLRGYFEVYRRDLPVYITVDSILDALHLSFDRILRKVEEEVLRGELRGMLEAMEAGIDDLAAQAPGLDISRELDDVAVWVCVARSLLEGQKIPCARGADEEADAILSLVAAGAMTRFELFGADLCMDFSQFRPRGHYTLSETLERYFRSMQWVQRAGLKFVQFPRHARVAALLSRLLEETGAIEKWRTIDETVKSLVGRSDSLDPPGWNTFLEQSGYGLADLYDEARYDAFRADALRTGLGAQEINGEALAQNPYDPAGFTRPPPLFHVMGQRFALDSFILSNVVWDRVCARGCPRPCPPGCGRVMPSPLDVMFVLGNRATVPLLESELERWDYHANLGALDWLAQRQPPEFWNANLYNVWLSALRELDRDTTSRRYPPVMRTFAWDERVLNTQLASWSPLRHDTILYAKPSYGPGGCYYPDGWVDPYPEVYDRIADFAAKAGEIPVDDPRYRGAIAQAYFRRLEATSRTLSSIARAELDGVDLTPGQSLFLRQILTKDEGYDWNAPPERTEPIAFDGWYAGIIFDFDAAHGESFQPTIADVHTSTDPEEVLSVGTGHPNPMAISIENECGVRAYAGPVFSYHELTEGGVHRWTDEEWKQALEDGLESRPAWTRDFIR